ncbi:MULTISPECIES: glycoside hydrolase family 3 C-terminal domain-containing protein [unclassified Leifsonia]|uniref:beta-glucosidase n=1 Tax=unclassified Leifsonia TaxID=2663824 RepID=UPI0008A7CCD7|nr:MULTISPECIES: glycoside hydrolase family 3 C-terminal domain-containing protein [unclassified Leifsonia]SEI15125.1 beta-glucosidase [Leifsonia sp. CL154]SFM04112.1 beta-glucosidase [Leifsonia sp. CL147]
MTSTTPEIDRLLTERDRIRSLVASLTLDEKVALLTGHDFWHTRASEKIGLGPLVLSDGPTGVRGATWDERDPSLGLPSGTSLAASWDRDAARRYGAVLADEARRKGVHVVLGPTVNLHRSPHGGRHFEAFSEDPLLTTEMAAAYVKGMQDGGVAATPKHYVGNDYETDRFTADTVVSERALRELYLFAFERAVTEGRAWAVMSSYNRVNGTTMTENDLLETPLNSEWGFDGVVVGDWLAVRSIASANASQDLSMPGPEDAWGDALVTAVRDGRVTEGAVDRKVARILTLAARVGQLEAFGRATVIPSGEDPIAFAHETAVDGMVLVENNGILPLSPEPGETIGVFGQNAAHARTQGGGSATVVPEHTINPLDGLRAALPHTRVVFATGAVVQNGVAPIPANQLINPVTGGSGLHVRLLSQGSEVLVEDRFSTALTWFGDGQDPISRADRLEITTAYTPPGDGVVQLGIGAAGVTRLWVDGRLVLDEDIEAVGDMLGASAITPPSRTVPVATVAGTPVDIRIEHDIEQGSDLANMVVYLFGIQPDDSDPARLIAEAVELARNVTTAVVVVGTNERVESEGIDRADIALPGRQNELVSAIAAANPNTIVVVNAGAPVEMPWRKDVAAVLLTWFGGQEYGRAVADVLLGTAEPGGRLPTTWPDLEADVPAIDVVPHNGVVRYDEGIHVGYRAWLKRDRTPAYPFGYGLGYTTWRIDEVAAAATPSGRGALVTARVANTGTRPGKHVVQVYASRKKSSIDRPERWLVGFASVRLAAGESTTVSIDIDERAFAHWEGGWRWEPGEFALHIGTSVSDEVARSTIAVG